MEKWIEKNQNKIFLVCAIFTMWCFYSVVHQGGNLIPRIHSIEYELNLDEARFNDVWERLRYLETDHTHYYNGKPK